MLANPDLYLAKGVIVNVGRRMVAFGRKMVGNGRKWSEMVGNGQKWSSFGQSLLRFVVIYAEHFSTAFATV